MVNKHKQNVQDSQLVGGSPVGYIQSAAKELNLRQPRTNPVKDRIEGLNQGPLDYKNSAPTT